MADQEYKVRDPSGRERVIRGPAGATDDQIIAQAKNLFSADQPIDLQAMQQRTREHRDMQAAIENDPLSRGARDDSREGKLPTWLAGDPGATYPQRVMATPGAQFATGAAAPIMGGAQLLGNATGIGKDAVNNTVQTGAEMAQAGGAGGMNPFNIAGQIMSPVNLGLAKIAPAATGVGRVAQGAGMGGVVGATTPVTQPGDYWDQKGAQTLTGAAGGAAVPTTGMLADFLMGKGSRRIMQSAMKPGANEPREKVERGITTMLSGGERGAGFNATLGGMRDLESAGQAKNAIAARMLDARAGATIDPQQLTESVDAVRNRLAGKFYPPEDLQAVDKVKADFLGNPNVANLGAEGDRLAATAADREAAKISALQDAGRFQTFAAQQENLAHGGGIRATSTPLNEPYTNVGAADTRLSPSAYPVPGEPRIPGRYTANIDRVPEGQSAAADALRIAKVRGAEQTLAEQQLRRWQAAGGGNMPLSMAQQLKQGLHEQLRDKYGALSSPETEGMKGLAYGARKAIEEVAPEVAPVNAQSADLWNALNISRRAANASGNNNPIGLAAPIAAAGGHVVPAAVAMADRNAWVRSILARALHQGNRAVQPVARSKQAAIAAAILANQSQEQE